MVNKSLINFFLIIALVFFPSCGEEKGSDGYKKQSDIPVTWQSIEKKNSPGKKVSDYY